MSASRTSAHALVVRSAKPGPSLSADGMAAEVTCFQCPRHSDPVSDCAACSRWRLCDRLGLSGAAHLHPLSVLWGDQVVDGPLRHQRPRRRLPVRRHPRPEHSQGRHAAGEHNARPDRNGRQRRLPFALRHRGVGALEQDTHGCRVQGASEIPRCAAHSSC